MEIIKKVMESIQSHNEEISLLHKISKAVVVFALLYCALIIYNLGNVVLSGVIALIAIVYLVLTKLDSVI